MNEHNFACQEFCFPFVYLCWRGSISSAVNSHLFQRRDLGICDWRDKNKAKFESCLKIVTNCDSHCLSGKVSASSSTRNWCNSWPKLDFSTLTDTGPLYRGARSRYRGSLFSICPYIKIHLLSYSLSFALNWVQIWTGIWISLRFAHLSDDQWFSIYSNLTESNIYFRCRQQIFWEHQICLSSVCWSCQSNFWQN